MNIKKRLKNEAKNLLPDESLKASIFENIKASEDYQLVTNENTTISTNNQKTKIIVISTVVLLLVVFVSTLLGVFLSPKPVTFGPIDEFLFGNSYLNIQINPGFEIKVDSNNLVTEVKATNSDGALVIYGTNFTGMPLDKACNKIIKSADALGFLTKTDKDINIIAFNENQTISDTVSESVRLSIDTYVKQNNINKNVKVISKSRSDMEQIALQFGLNEEQVKTNKVQDLARQVTSYNANSVTKTTDRINDLVLNDEAFKTLTEELDKVDELEDALEDIIDYLDDVLGEEKEEDEDEEEDEEELEIFDPKTLIELINNYNNLAIDCFADYKYVLKVDINNINQTNINELLPIREELKTLMGNEDEGTGVDGLEEQLENALDKYKLERFGNIDFDEDDD